MQKILQEKTNDRKRTAETASAYARYGAAADHMNRTGIPKNLKNGFEAISGLSFDDVRVHYSSSRPEQLNACAYAQGNHVYIGPGQERCLPHELGHVVQQKQGRVKATACLGQVAINDNTALEQEASMLGRMALQRREADGPETLSKGIRQDASPVQMISHAEFGEVIKIQKSTKTSPGRPLVRKRSAKARPKHAAAPSHKQPLHSKLPTEAEPKQEGELHQEQFLPPETSAYPAMIYETFGPEINELVNVYEQSCTYPGLTCCIIGFNQRYLRRDYSAASCVPEGTGELCGVLADGLMQNHDAFVVPFKWMSVGKGTIGRKRNEGSLKSSKTKKGKGGSAASILEPVRMETPQEAFAAEDIAAPGGYAFPYFEVRAKLMVVGQEIAGGLPDGRNVLFRWIDRDARGDTSFILDAGFLTGAAADGRSYFITGAYDWMPGPEEQGIAGFADFLNIFNNYERQLRAAWFSIRSEHQINSGYFYLPETLLIMNNSAHKAALNNLLIAAKNAADTEGQSKESMTAFGSFPVDSVRFENGYSAKKPNKHLAGQSESYLGNLQRLFNCSGTPDFDAFCKELQKTRQSAFDNGQWGFVCTAPYKEWQDERLGLQEAEKYKNLPEGDSHFAQLKFNNCRYTFAKELYICLKELRRPPKQKQTLKRK